MYCPKSALYYREVCNHLASVREPSTVEDFYEKFYWTLKTKFAYFL